jgi:hypothetical protein
MMKKIVSLVLGICLLVIPTIIIAEETEDACIQAQIDVERNVNGPLWFGVGCLFGVFGWGAAYLLPPSPSPVNLMGKSSEYVMVYTSCYKEKGKSIQANKALIGCLAWAAFYSTVALLASDLGY